MLLISLSSFFFNDTPTPEIYTLSLHDALPISAAKYSPAIAGRDRTGTGSTRNRMGPRRTRSEEHTSELQSRFDLVCRLLLEKKKLRMSAPLSPCSGVDQAFSPRSRHGV